MQVWEEFLLPRSHVLIDDFLNIEELESVLNEVNTFNDLAKEGLIFDFSSNTHIKDSTKQNRVFNLDPYFKSKRNESKILTILEKKIWANKEFFEKLKELRDPIYETLLFTNTDITQISYYGNTDKYDWHEDSHEDGYLTFVLMLNNEPKQFSGGNFEMRWNNEIKTIEFKNNRMLIFARSTLHRVTPIILSSENPFDQRITIQHWPKYGKKDIL